jgi:hypothetical protein
MTNCNYVPTVASKGSTGVVAAVVFSHDLFNYWLLLHSLPTLPKPEMP